MKKQKLALDNLDFSDTLLVGFQEAGRKTRSFLMLQNSPEMPEDRMAW
jgi:hypothetical protein